MSVISEQAVAPNQNGHASGSHAVRETSAPGDVRPSRYFRWKAALDRTMAAVLLIPALPIIGLLVILVRLTSRGPGIYRQARVGKNGRRFTMYKIRTMTQDAEQQTGAVWSVADDKRITRLGRILRKLHLDEFPQLFNVLRGVMSLVGPRPERPEFVDVLGKLIPGYAKRLAVPPGITGLAQINLRPDSDLDSVRRKLLLDLDYIEHAGLGLDLRVILCTMLRLLKIPGDRHIRWLGLRRKVVLSGDQPSSGENGKSVESFVSPESILVRSNGDGCHHAARDASGAKAEDSAVAEGLRKSRPR